MLKNYFGGICAADKYSISSFVANILLANMCWISFAWTPDWLSKWMVDSMGSGRHMTRRELLGLNSAVFVFYAFGITKC